MMAWLKAWYRKRWLRQHGIKLSVDPGRLPRRATLFMEEGVSIGDVFVAFTHLQVGTMTYIRSGCELINVSHIGRFCSIANGVIIGLERAGHPLGWVSSHPFQYTGTSLRYDMVGKPAIIGHDVWIGRDALIMEGVEVGIGAVVAARSVVTENVPDYAIVAGTPARIVGRRHRMDICTALLASAWWELPVECLQKLPMNHPEAFLESLPRCGGVAVKPLCVRVTSTDQALLKIDETP